MSYKTDFFRNPHALAGVDESEPILVALSGGADSSCLLHLLNEYASASGCKLYAAHVNHNIRTDGYGDEAARDEEFCRRLCAGLGVELFVLNALVPSIAKESGESLETAARRVRYEFFADIMRSRGIKILATAHNADDNLETQIFNLCRGCSTDGLCGIPRTRPFVEANGIIVRPMLDATKAEILDFCRNNGIKYVTDSTNLEDDCTRNRIRHNVIPELVSLFGTPQRAAMRLACSAESDSDLIRGHVERFISSNPSSPAVDDLKALHPAILTRVIASLFKITYGTALESVHIMSITRLLDAQTPCGSVSLPCRARAVVKRGRLVFEADERDSTEDIADYDIALTEGLNIIDGTDFAILMTKSAPPCDIPHNYEKHAAATLYCHPDPTLTARPRREGDTVEDGGMHKKLKKLMCDKKVPSEARGSLPLVIEDGQIIYAPLCAIADRAKAQPNKQKINISILKKTEKTKL